MALQDRGIYFVRCVLITWLGPQKLILTAACALNLAWELHALHSHTHTHIQLFYNLVWILAKNSSLSDHVYGRKL
jgi:hypothetical protein